MVTYTFTPEELDAVLDALVKGASRHTAFANFNPAGKNTRKHEGLARTMVQLRRKLQTYRTAS